jgi:hypothetical protein
MPIVFGHVMSFKNKNSVTVVSEIIKKKPIRLNITKSLTIAARQYGFNRNVKSSSGKLHLKS